MNESLEKMTSINEDHKELEKMTKTNRRGRVACIALLGGMAATMMTAPAVAGDIFERDRGESMKDAPMDTGRKLELSANVGLTSDYVFRGASQSAEHPAIQGGMDATYGILYAGFWGSSIDFGAVGTKDVADLELDLYAGITPKLGPVDLDLGVIGYLYPGASDQGAELDFIELKAGATTSPVNGLTLGGTVFYSPEYTGELGETWTLEGSVEVALPKIGGRITPTFSALVGTVLGEDNSGILAGQDEYVYWNAGMAFGFADKFSLDLRYWDTDVGDKAGCKGATFQCDSRFVVGLSASF